LLQFLDGDSWLDSPEVRSLIRDFPGGWEFSLEELNNIRQNLIDRGVRAYWFRELKRRQSELLHEIPTT